MIFPGEHVSIFGMSGCGKSTLTRKLASAYSRLVVFDRLSEWGTSSSILAHDFLSFASAFKEVYLLDSFQIIIRPQPGLSLESLESLTAQCLNLIYQVEREQYPHCKGLGIFFEEIWLYAPIHSPNEWLNEILLTGRHFRLSIVGNAQRPGVVSKILVSQSRHVFIGEFFEYRDREYYRQTLGDIELDSGPPQKFEFYWFRPGQKLIQVKLSSL